jgi:hypothetical protein
VSLATKRVDRADSARQHEHVRWHAVGESERVGCRAGSRLGTICLNWDAQLRWIGVGSTPASLAREHAAPDMHEAKHPVELRPPPATRALQVSAERLDIAWGVDAAVTRRRWGGMRRRRPSVLQALGFKLAGAWPARLVENAAKIDAAPILREQPNAPAEERLVVIGRALA